tara:strand:+ start:8982 stop:9725 length:744 start_codon:yes stop_codon:yes gene_type:complete
MKTLVLTIWFAFCAIAVAQEPQPGERGLLPLRPQQLLAVLPRSREGWTLKRSTASNGVDEWLQSQAERIFELPPPPEDQEKGAKPALTRISIVDTAKKGSSLEIFKDFQPGEVEDGVEGLSIDGMPAYRSVSGPVGQLEVMIDERFVLEILLRNQKESAFKEWLKLCQIDKLRGAASGSRVVPFPEEVTIVEIDELDSEKSYSYRLSMSTGNEIERQLIQEEQMMKMIEDALAEGKDLEGLDLSEFE